MTARRLRAPATDGGLLVEPPASAIAGQIAANARQLGRLGSRFPGPRGAAGCAPAVRREVLTAAQRVSRTPRSAGTEYRARRRRGSSELPLVVTGHQPELFHPGVWIKNFAAAAIADASGGVGLNLIVDNDIPKSASIRVPTIDDGSNPADPGRVRSLGGRDPYEDWPVRDEDLFATFADRVRAVAG